MKNIRIVSKLGLALVILFSSLTVSSAYAEYYVVASAPCAGGRCYSNCAPVPVYHKRVYRRHYYRPKHHYYRPVSRCYANRCGYQATCNTCSSGCSGCVRTVYPSAWVKGHWNCYGEWVPGHWRNYYYQTNYGYPNMIYDPDLTTGDDNPMVDPDMDIDR